MADTDKNRGFPLVEVLLTLLIVAALAFAGWTWYQANTEDGNDEDTASEEFAEDEARLAAGELIEIDPPIRVGSVEELGYLPESTPESFVVFMEEEMEGFDEPFIAPDEDVECRSVYEFDLISTVNIRASQRIEPVDPMDEGLCESAEGDQHVWHLTGEQSGQWGETTVAHSPLFCEELEENGIYEEFIESCLDDANEPASNPNGSITQLAD